MSAIKISVSYIDFHQAHRHRKPVKERKATASEYKQIIYEFGDIISDLAVKTGNARIPISCWMLKIFKVKNTTVNKRLSSIYKTEVLNFNDHTEGFSATAILQMTDTINKKRRHYDFKVCRKMARNKMAKSINENPAILNNYPIKKPKPIIQ